MKVLWIFVVTLLPTPVLAVPDAASLCALANRLEPFVAAATGIAAASQCPVIGFELPTGADLARSQAGAYHPASGRIDLAPDLNLDSILGQSFLVHELVHAAQYRAGKDQTAPCPAALEGEAYRVQADFLHAHGMIRDAVITRVMGAQLGTCGSPGYGN